MTTAFDSPHHRVGLVLAALGAIAFSFKAILVKLAYRYGVDAITLVMLRMVFSLPLFVILALWAGRGRARLSLAQWRRMALLGLTGYFLASTLDFVGLQYISASLERLIIYLTPTLVLLLGWRLLKRRITRPQWQAMAISYLGIVMVFGHEFLLGMTVMGSGAAHSAKLTSPASATLLGSSLVFASAMAYAIYLVYSGEFVKEVGAMRLAGWATSVACVLCMIQFACLRPLSALHVPAPVLWLSVINALGCTVLPVLAVMMAVERIGAGLVSQIGMLGPVSTIAMGALILNEPFAGWTVAGTVLVMSGVYWVTRSPAQASAARHNRR